MTLLEIRNWFVLDSGRYDLRAADLTDNGANKYIAAGTRLLDHLAKHNKSNAEHIEDLIVGQYKLDISNCRSIHSVFVGNADGRWKLERKDFDILRQVYTEPEADIDGGRPLYYAINILGLEPAQKDVESYDVAYDYGNVMFGAHQIYRGIWWMPPVDEVYTMSIFGIFDSITMTADTDVNNWSMNYPDLLVQASIYALTQYNNRSRATTELDKVLFAMKNLDYDAAEQEMAEYTEMEG